MITQQIHKKKYRRKAPVQIVVSKEFQELLDTLPLPDFEKLQDRVDRIFEKGREEGMKDKLIGKYVRQNMKTHYSYSTIRRVLEKYPKAVGKYTKPVTNDEKSSKMEDLENKNDNVDSDEEKESQGIGTREAEPNAMFYFKPDEFKVEQLTEKNRAYLIDAVEHWHTEARKLQEKVKELDYVITDNGLLQREITMFKDMMKSDPQLKTLVQNKIDVEVKRQDSPKYKRSNKESALEGYVSNLRLQKTWNESGLGEKAAKILNEWVNKK